MGMVRSVESLSLALSRCTVGKFGLGGGRTEHGRLCGTRVGEGWIREGVVGAPGFVVV